MRLAVALLLAAAPALASAQDALAPGLTAAAVDSGKKAAPAKAAPVKTDAFKNDGDRTLYALGFFLGSRLEGTLKPLELSASETTIVEKGLRDNMLGKKAQVDMNQYGPKINELAQERLAKAGVARKAKEKKFLDAEAGKKDARKLAGGVLYFEEKAGTGEQPRPEDTVKVNYEGKLVDGKIFDSSYKRGEPAEFPLNGVIECWTTGVAQMKVGGKARLVCPSDMAYGDRGSPPTIPGGATLVFEVELLGVKKADKKAEEKGADKSSEKDAQALAKRDKEFREKAAKEKGAKALPDGLIYKDLKAGTGAQPTADSTVKVNYRGTLTDGTEFDSSYKRNEPATFPLRGVIKCWTEGVAMMKVGGKAQLVCPSDIAYGDMGRPPQIPGGATLVFEVELLEIVK